MEFECKNYKDKCAVIAFGIGLVFLYLISYSIFATILSAFFNKDTYLGENIIYILSSLIVTLILVLIFHKKVKKDLINFKKNYKTCLKTAFKCWFIGFILMCVTNIIINLIVLNNGMAANEVSNRETFVSYPIYSIISMCILGPICEELLFRLPYKKVFKNIISYSIITGLFFASMHIIDYVSFKHIYELLYLIPYSSLGIALSYAFYKTDNIWTSIIMHMFHNTLCVLTICLSYLCIGVI